MESANTRMESALAGRASASSASVARWLRTPREPGQGHHLSRHRHQRQTIPHALLDGGHMEKVGCQVAIY